jgi:hypothetical protein
MESWCSRMLLFHVSRYPHLIQADDTRRQKMQNTEMSQIAPITLLITLKDLVVSGWAMGCYVKDSVFDLRSALYSDFHASQKEVSTSAKDKTLGMWSLARHSRGIPKFRCGRDGAHSGERPGLLRWRDVTSSDVRWNTDSSVDRAPGEPNSSVHTCACAVTHGRMRMCGPGFKLQVPSADHHLHGHPVTGG